MAAPYAVLGFENPDGSFVFGLTDKPMNYLARFVDDNARLRWAVPAQTYPEAQRLRDRWNFLGSEARVEFVESSVPETIISELYEIWFNGTGQSAEEEALRLIGEHRAHVTGNDGRRKPSHDSTDPPHACPFIPLPKHLEPSTNLKSGDVDLGIKLAIFDLDMTLVNSSGLERARENAWKSGDWADVKRRIGQVTSLKCWDGCAPHQLPGLLAEQGVKIALVSRAPRWYVDSLVERFDIYADETWAPSRDNKTMAFKKAMEQFGVEPGQTVVFGDDKSDFKAAANHGILSMGNPWISATPPAAPDVAWFDSASLLERGAWRQRLPYVGEADLGKVEWHRGSLISFEEDAYALGRYFKGGQSRHQDRLSQGIIAGKSKFSGDPCILDAFRTTVRHLAKRADIDVVTSIPSHKWNGDRFAPFRRIVVSETGAVEGIDVRTCFEVPRDYKGRSRDYKRSTREGRFEISDNLADLTVLLIDDTVTTGSTMGALKDAAERAGAARVIQLAFGFTQD